MSHFSGALRARMVRKKKFRRCSALVSCKGAVAGDGTRQLSLTGVEVRRMERQSYRQRMYEYNKRIFERDVLMLREKEKGDAL